MTKRLEDYGPFDGLGGTYSEDHVRIAIAIAEAAGLISSSDSGGTDGTVTQVLNRFNILEQYQLSDIDNAGYYGYVNKDGDWYIKRVTDTSIRFYKNSDIDYPAAWTARVHDDYVRFDIAF